MKLSARKSPGKRGNGPRARRGAGLVLAAALACGVMARGNDGNAQAAADASASPGASAVPGASAAAEASASPAEPKFNVPIPPGHGALKVQLPYFDEMGKLQMFFNIAKSYRRDLDHLEMKGAYMQTYDEKGVPDANVYMTRCVLDLNTRIVTSEVPVTVRRSDFQIVGQKMVFNTQTRVGRMTGHVTMVIYNRTSMTPATPSPSPSPAAGNAAAKGAVTPHPTP